MCNTTFPIYLYMYVFMYNLFVCVFHLNLIPYLITLFFALQTHRLAAYFTQIRVYFATIL